MSLLSMRGRSLSRGKGQVRTLFAAEPYALMQLGFFFFMTAVWIIVPQALRPVSPYEVWRRVANAPD